MKVVNYIKNIFVGIWHLGQGMYVTMLNFCRPKVTQQYPENRGCVTPRLLPLTLMLTGL